MHADSADSPGLRYCKWSLRRLNIIDGLHNCGGYPGQISFQVIRQSELILVCRGRNECLTLEETRNVLHSCFTINVKQIHYERCVLNKHNQKHLKSVIRMKKQTWSDS